MPVRDVSDTVGHREETRILLQLSGSQSLSARQGCSAREFKGEGPEMGGRIAVVVGMQVSV